MNGLPGTVESIYRLVLRAYPSEYIETFGDEMQNTFIEGLDEAVSCGTIFSFILHETRDLPKSLINAYWYGWSRKLLNGIDLLQQATSSADLPPAQPDGRDSWRQVLFEMSSFVIAGLLLVIATYLPLESLRPGWQHNVEFLGNIILPITIPFLLFGLARGLPRWTYPLAGLSLSYFGLITSQTSLWLFLTIMLLASSLLFLAALLTDPQPSRLPVPIRRIGQSLSVDWTRLSFGVYGAMPLVLLMAFDDAHTNSRTLYFAVSVLVTVISALLYCRSRDATLQITILLAGLTFSIWCAWLDKISFAGGLKNWIIVTASGIESSLWMAVLWAQWVVLILLPVVFILFNRLVHLKRAV